MSTEAVDGYGDDEIFYGSARVYLAPAAGKTLPYNHAEWKTASRDDKASLALTLQRAGRQAANEGETPDIVEPAIPALEIIRADDADGTAAGAGGDVSAWPTLLQAPLLKVKEEEAIKDLKAVASGVRSCLVKLEGKWYRLKGSGNNDEGFVIRQNAASVSTGDAWRDIRGCAFWSTALRENYMSAHLAAVLDPQGIVGCNTAKGVYVYGPPNEPLGPRFAPACIVEETKGDRRLGSHILAGIMVLLPELVDESKIDAETLLSMFPDARPGKESLDELITTAQLTTSAMMGFTMGVPGHGLEWGDVPRDETTFAYLGNLEGGLPVRAPMDPSTPPKQYVNEGPQPMDPKWREQWAKICSQLQSKILGDGAAGAADGAAGSKLDALSYLFSRIGYDCGKVARGLHENRVSWGTYQDEMCRRDYGEFHCNAHSNNVVLLEEDAASGREAFLGYLDLDMAFDEATFVDTWGEGGALAAEEYTHLLKREHLNFMEVLSGGDSTSGVPAVATAEVAGQSKVLLGVQTALYDTLVLGYLNAYTGEERYPVAPFDAGLHAAAYDICRLAVVVMADFIA